MIQYISRPVLLFAGQPPTDADTRPARQPGNPDELRKGTMAWQILSAHNSGADDELRIRFDALCSHDITYVGIIQTARASGLERFPVPYVLTNCHNTLCAVGGTINEDDHLFGLSAAHKYGGIFVPGHQAVIHQYMRECFVGCGRMILGSDSHTRYGALGALGVGEGGPELVKQLLSRTYDLPRPDVMLVWLTGEAQNGVGPQDVALAIIEATFKNGLAKNKVLEFAGPGVCGLSMDFRNGVDVMTTETTCLSSIWQTDEKTREYYRVHGRPEAYQKIEPQYPAQYDCALLVDLSEIRPMIALPFHPSNAYPIDVFNQNAADILREVERETGRAMEAPGLNFDLAGKLENGRLRVDQGVIAGCSGGTFENVSVAARMLKNSGVGAGAFGLSVYPASQPIYLELTRNGDAAALLEAGVIMRSAFCGPCFGAGDVPAHGGLSIRHTTRNFPNREGSKPGNGQVAAVALMDARSIAATALNAGLLTSASEYEIPKPAPYRYDDASYRNRVYQGFGMPKSGHALRFGPNIADWPEMKPLPEHLALIFASIIRDPVTTTDELIPSGETSSYRSNPMKLAEFTLSRKDPAYVGRAREIKSLEDDPEFYRNLSEKTGLAVDAQNCGLGSVIFAVKPGDGSAREQAASCQKVLGGWANIALEYATKRYRSNLINWGMLPLLCAEEDAEKFALGATLLLPDIRKAVQSGEDKVSALLIQDGGAQKIALFLPVSQSERPILLAGCLINYYSSGL